MVQQAHGPWLECPVGESGGERKDVPRTWVQELAGDEARARVFVVHSEERQAYERGIREAGGSGLASVSSWPFWPISEQDRKEGGPSMATLVTGGTGFVASNVVRTLAERGHQVVCYDLVAPHPLLHEYIKPWADRITFVQGDILRQEDLSQLLGHGITKIVHAAIFTGVLPEVEAGRGRSIVDINVMGTTNLLELARQLPIDRFLYVSSGAIYGEDYDHEVTLVEDTVPRPRTLYALTKYTSELLTRRYGELHGFPTVSTRLGSPFGPMERVTDHRVNQSVLKGWTGNIVKGESVEVADRTVETRFTYVADIANGIATVLDAPSLSYDIYNVAGEERRSIGYIMQVLEEVHPGLRVVDVPSTAPIRGGPPMSSARLQSDLGFVPQFDLRSGIREYLAWRQATGFTD